MAGRIRSIKPEWLEDELGLARVILDQKDVGCKRGSGAGALWAGGKRGSKAV